MLFAVALHSVANDYFAEKQAEQDIYMAMSTMKGDTHETVSSPQTPYFPDAELAGTGIQTHQIAMSRIQRIQAAESIFSLKALAQGWQTVMLFYLSIGGSFMKPLLLIVVIL